MTGQDTLLETSELRLELTEKFAKADASAIRAVLNRHLRVSKPVYYHRASIDPPSVIQLIGAAALWLPLVTAATAFAKSFFSTLGKRAADAVWNRSAARKESKDIEPLVDVVNALVSAAARVGGRVIIRIGLDIPDDFFGTVISTESRDPLEVARTLASFVVCAEKISDAVQAEIERGYKPLRPFVMELEQDGSVTIRWTAASDSKTYEKHIP